MSHRAFGRQRRTEKHRCITNIHTYADEGEGRELLLDVTNKQAIVLTD